jgi:hypothetical protein
MAVFERHRKLRHANEFAILGPRALGEHLIWKRKRGKDSHRQQFQAHFLHCSPVRCANLISRHQ